MEQCKILPTIVYKQNIQNEFSNEIKSLMETPLEVPKVKKPHGYSTDRYILNSPQYSNIKLFIENAINKYFAEVLAIDGESIITQSWVNANRPNEFAHLHTHPNSFASGVLYLYVNDKNGEIKFHGPSRQNSTINYTLKPKPIKPDVDGEIFSVKTGDLIIFPSFLPHSVPKNTSNETRWSMAFNSLTKNVIGEYETLTEFRF